MIGNMHFINLFKDPWASLLPFSNWPTFINVHADVITMVVSDIIIPNKEWNVPSIANFMLAEMMTHISGCL